MILYVFVKGDSMSLKDELKSCIIDQIQRDNEWFYHGFFLTSFNGYSDFINMYNNGIKCSYLRHSKRSGGNNGNYYVSLSKINNCNPSNSSYLQITHSRPAFIISGIKPIKTINFDIPTNSILPIRSSSYEDEFQQFLKVNPKNFIGIQMAMSEIENLINRDPDYVKMFSNIFEYLIFIESILPFYVYDNPQSDLFLVDKEKCRNLINKCL